VTRRDDDTNLLTTVSPEERDVCDELKRLALLDTDANLLRLALWHLARWYELALPDEIFALRVRGRSCPPVPASRLLHFSDREADRAPALPFEEAAK
jgi:hypothetical protein